MDWFIWTCLLDGGDPVQWSLLMGYLSIAFLVFATWHLLVTLHASPQWIWVGAILIAVDPSMILEAVQGLESVFYSGLLALMVSQAIREREDDGVHFISLVLAMLLCLTRPEAPLFVGLLYIGLWSFDFDWKRSLMPLCAMGLFLGALTIGRLFYFGDPLPNTFYAKVGGWAGERGCCIAGCILSTTRFCGWGCSHRFDCINRSPSLLLWVLLPYLFYVISIGVILNPPVASYYRRVDCWLHSPSNRYSLSPQPVPNQ